MGRSGHKSLAMVETYTKAAQPKEAGGMRTRAKLRETWL